MGAHLVNIVVCLHRSAHDSAPSLGASETARRQMQTMREGNPDINILNWIIYCVCIALRKEKFHMFYLCRASSRSLLFTVKRLWPLVVPGANRLWVPFWKSFTSHFTCRRWPQTITSHECLVLLSPPSSTTTKCPASCCSSLKSLVQ